MGRPIILKRRALFKRLRQAVYLMTHPLSHLRCATAIQRSGLTADPFIPLRYLGDHLALSMRAPERRAALIGHYEALPDLLRPAARAQLRRGVVIWKRDPFNGSAPLTIVLEPSQLAPMEGELQLRFAYRSNLYALTFLVAPGAIFGSDHRRVLFIGGVQGRIGSRQEMREASKLNDEISPATMLMLTVQMLAKVLGIDGILGVGEKDHISMGYSPEKIIFDYRRFWTEIGGELNGAHYRLPMESPQKPLAEIPISHRRRARVRREVKRLVCAQIEQSLRQILQPRHRLAIMVPANDQFVPAEAWS